MEWLGSGLDGGYPDYDPSSFLTDYGFNGIFFFFALPEPNSRNGCRPDLLFLSYTSFLFVGGAEPAHWDSRPLLSRFNVFAEFVEYLSCNQLRQLDLLKRMWK